MEYISKSNFDNEGFLLYGAIVRSGASMVRRHFAAGSLFLVLLVSAVSIASAVREASTTCEGLFLVTYSNCVMESVST